MSHKYKVGDKVRVRTGLKGGESYDGLYFAHDMEKYCGKEFIVKTTRGSREYKLQDTGEWVFNDAMFEDASVKFKVGDKVRLKKDLKVGERYGDMPLHEFLVFKGTNKVVRVDKDGTCLLDDPCYYYTFEMLEIVTDSDEPSWDIPTCEEIHTLNNLVRVTVFNHWWCPTHGVEAILLKELSDGTMVVDLGFVAPFTHTCNGLCKSGTGYYENKKNIKLR
jgi:hypothetical protein